MDTTIAIADTTRIIADPVTVQFLKDFLISVLPWLDIKVIDYLSNYLGAIPVVIMVLGYDVVRNTISRNTTLLKGLLSNLEKYSWIINPILAAIVSGTFFGNSTLGLIAGGVWTMIKKPLAKTTVVGLTKAKHVALIAISLLLLSSAPSFAQQTPKVSLLNPVRFSYGIGITSKWEDLAVGTNQYYCGVAQLGYNAFDHIGIRTRVEKDLKFSRKRTNYEVGLWLTF